MKNYFVLIAFLLALQISAQSDVKKKFQKNRYDLAVSYYKKLDYAKAIDLFALASKIDPENPIGLESHQIVDTLKIILRNELVDELQGTWKKTGNEPSWTVTQKNKVSASSTEEIVVVNAKKMEFYEQDLETNERKLLKSEDLVFYDKEELNGLFSDIILADGTIWSYIVDEAARTLRVVYVGKETEDGIEKVVSDNPEIYYIRPKQS